MRFIRKKYVGERFCVQKDIQELHIRKRIERLSTDERFCLYSKIELLSKNYLRCCPEVRVIRNAKLAGALWKW